MRIIGIGTDIVELERVRRARFLSRAAEYILNPGEIREMSCARDAVQFLSSRLAAKEAVIKACPGPCSYHDVVIAKNGDTPVAKVTSRPDCHFFISIAHSFEHAVANAVAVEI